MISYSGFVSYQLLRPAVVIACTFRLVTMMQSEGSSPVTQHTGMIVEAWALGGLVEAAKDNLSTTKANPKVSSLKVSSYPYRNLQTTVSFSICLARSTAVHLRFY
jgi:hypothetical protein